MADSLLDNFLQVYQGLLAISQAHDDQDEDSQDDRKHRPAVASPELSLCALGAVLERLSLWWHFLAVLTV